MVAASGQDALAQEFVEFAVRSGVLRFGEFKTKAGVEEIGAHAARLGLELAEAQHPRIQRELHELLGKLAFAGLVLTHHHL